MATRTDHALALKRFGIAKSAWSDARQEFTDDLRFISGNPDDQWEPTVKNSRDAEYLPVLTFDRCHPIVQQIVNRSRQERPQPKILPGDDGDDDTADVLEGKLRHMQYASQADVAYDCATMYAAAGGFGFYDVTREFVDPTAESNARWNQEPRIRRVPDPLAEYPDPAAKEYDFSDASWWITRTWISREKFEEDFPDFDPVPFDADANGDWANEENVCIAKYFWVENTTRKRVQYEDPQVGVLDDWEDTLFPTGIPDEYKDGIVNSRDVPVRIVHEAVIDGAQVLRDEIWPGRWIPKIPILAQELIVEGKRRFISAIRYQRSPQKLINAAASAIAEALAVKEKATLIGYKGQFKDAKWKDGKRHRYLEVEPVTVDNKPAPLPQFNTYEPPIQALSQAMMIATDVIKSGFGYVDNVLKPSQADISGVAIQRRAAQQDLTNFHFEDNLVRSQWHAARVMIDLFIQLTDTSRPARVRKEDGQTSVQPIGVALEDGTIPQVPGFEGQKHHQINTGSYEVEITTGPGYAMRREEELDRLTQLIGANPALFPLYADRVFHLMGYRDLEERAEMLLPPQIQQALQGKQQGLSPREVQLQGQLAQVQAFLQKVLGMVQMKTAEKGIEAKNKLDLHKLDTIKDITVQSMKHQHEHAENMTGHLMQAIETALGLFHEAELAPDPNAPPQAQGVPTQ